MAGDPMGVATRRHGQYAQTAKAMSRSTSSEGYPDGRGVERPHLDGQQLGYHALNRLYETKDGWLCIVIATDEHWDRLCVALDLTALAADLRFATASDRTRNDTELCEILESAFRKKTAAGWFRLLDQGGVPCEISDPNFSNGLHDDPEMIKRKWVVSYPQHYVGKLNQTGLLIDFSDTPGRIQGPPLVVGEQTEAIMTELGYSATDIEALARDRVIAVWSAETADRSTPQNPWAKKAG